MAAALKSDTAYFFFSGLAERIIAKAAAGRPNIIQGKKPDMYIPVVPAVPVFPQKLPRSFIPAASNQNTELSAW